MKTRKILSVIMAVLMMISLLPSLVFAAAVPQGALDGKLKIKGTAAVGFELSADYKKVKPKGMTDDYVSFSWSRKDGEVLTEVGTEKIYKPTEEDLGYVLVLKITGLEEMGVSGELKAKTPEIAATEEEAKALAELAVQEDAESESGEDVEVLEIAEEENSTEEIPETDAEENYDVEEISETDSGEGWDEVYEISEEGTPEETIEEIPETNGEEEWDEVYEVPEEAETPEEPAENLIYELQADTENAEGVMDFGTLDYGYEEVMEAQYATITNTGTGVLTFESFSPECFMVADILEPLQPGESVTVWAQPRTGLEPGTYMDTITYTSNEGAEASFQAAVTVAEPALNNEEYNTDDVTIEDIGTTEDAVDGNGEATTDVGADDAENNTGDAANDETGDGSQTGDGSETGDGIGEEPVVVNLSADSEAIIYNALTEGYIAAESVQYLTITNNGSEDVTIGNPFASNGNVDISLNSEMSTDEENLVLGAGLSATYSVTPKEGLGASDVPYEDMIVVPDTNGETLLSVPVNILVMALEIPDPSAVLSAENIVFDSVKEGYGKAPKAQTITITNGEVPVTLVQPTSDNFVVGELSATELGAGETATFTIRPAAGLAAGEYGDIIDLAIADGAVLGSVSVTFTVEKPDPVYALSVSPENLEFGVKEEGYKEVPKAQTVTVVNNGNVPVTLVQPAAEYFNVGKLSVTALKPGEKADFKVAPKKGLGESGYTEGIQVSCKENQNESAVVTALFEVTEKNVNLTAIHAAADITGLANGVKKSAKSLRLPETVVIVTTKGKMNAVVKWDVKGCSYDSESTAAQVFKVKGTVQLPEGVKNQDKISLITSVKVSVAAYEGAKVSDEEMRTKNSISGIDPNGAYTTDTKITFTANGYGMSNQNPRKGDVRYIPVNWKVLETRAWEGAPYTATFRMGKAGNYALSITFSRQKYDGSKWVSTGEQDVKKVSFTVGEGKTVSPTVTGIDLTPAAKKDANKKAAVRTGDNTVILPFIIILIAAAACIAGVVIYRGKKK